jgi:hypothetical protein
MQTTKEKPTSKKNGSRATVHTRRWHQFIRSAKKGKVVLHSSVGAPQAHVIRTDNPVYVKDIMQESRERLNKHLERLLKSVSGNNNPGKKKDIISLERKMRSAGKHATSIKTTVARLMADVEKVYSVNLIQAISEAAHHPRLHFPNDVPMIVGRPAYETSIRETQEADHANVKQ